MNDEWSLLATRQKCLDDGEGERGLVLLPAVLSKLSSSNHPSFMLYTEAT